MTPNRYIMTCHGRPKASGRLISGVAINAKRMYHADAWWTSAKVTAASNLWPRHCGLNNRSKAVDVVECVCVCVYERHTSVLCAAIVGTLVAL